MASFKRKLDLETIRCKKLRRNYCNCSKNPMQLMDLPVDIVADILVRLPVESLRCIRRVSKTLLDTVNSLSFVRDHTLSLIAGNSHVSGVPQLMCFAQTSPTGAEEDLPTLQSLRYDGGSSLTKGEYAFTHSTSILTETGYMKCFNFFNLFCMVSGDGHCLLINPLLREVLSLPTDNILIKYGPDSEVSIDWYGMGFDNTTNTFKIVRVSSIANKERKKMLAHILVLGTNSWREIQSVPPSGLNCMHNNLCAYGDMHWLRKTRVRGVTKSHITSFDFKKEEFCWTPTPHKLRSSNKHSNLQLLSLRGSMAIAKIFSFPEGGVNVEIWVMKDYAGKEWAQEYSIYVDMHPKSELKRATCGEWEHGIFFNDLETPFKSNGTFFVDLRCTSVNLLICPVETEPIMSYTGSLISLRDYGTLDSTDEPHDELVT